MDNDIKKVIRKNQLPIVLNSIMLNTINDTLTFEQVFLLYSKYLQDRYDEFKKEVKSTEDKIIKVLHQDLDFEYNLFFNSLNKYVNIILNSKTSIFSMAVEVQLDYFFKPFDSDRHISNISSKYELIGVYDSIKELKKEFVSLAEEYRRFVGLSESFKYTYPFLADNDIDIELRTNEHDIKLINLVITSYKEIDNKHITITYDYNGNYQTDLANATSSFPRLNFVLDDETITFIEEKILSKIKIPIKKLPDFLLKYIGYVEKNKEEDLPVEEAIYDEERVDKAYLSYQKIKENRKLKDSIKEKKTILPIELLKEIECNSNRHYIIRQEYKHHLQDYDLSKISFDNVDIREIDFSGTNIKSTNIDPQTVYNKDLSNCNFSVDEDNSKDYIFNYSTDFTEVKLNGTNMYNPHPCFLNSTIYNAYIDSDTLLPDYYAKSIESNGSRDKVKVKR